VDRASTSPSTTPAAGGISRRQVLLGGLALVGGTVLGPALTSCSPSSSATGTPVRYWHPLSGGDGITMADLVESINDEHGFAAEQTVLTWGTPYYTKLAMASAGGRAPDVAIMHASRILGYAPGGLLDPWDTDLLAELGVTEADFPAAVWEKGIVDGELYSLAFDSHPFILMYNTDVAEKAGALGDDGLLHDITSPEEFLDVARRMQEVTGKHGVSYGYLGDGAQMWRLFYTLYLQMGAEMTLDGDTVTLDEQAAITALEFMTQMLDGTVAASTGDYGTAVAEFLNGESGMFLTGVWELPTLAASGMAFDARTIPTLYGTDAVYGDSHAFVLPRQDDPDEEQRRETYRFVSEILKGSIVWAGAGHIPAYQPIVQSPAYDDLLPQAHYADAAENLNYDPEAWFSGSGSDFQGYFAENIQNVLLGQTDPAVGLRGFVDRLNSILAKPNPVTGT